LKKWGYTGNDKVIESGFSKASEINRNDLLEYMYKEKKINKRVPLVLTYHPSLEKISGIVRHHWKEIPPAPHICPTYFHNQNITDCSD
jgi:hypothetical protein